ncbi:uncharacterized protein LOC106171380 [Lingula anatina]|uniref:Uncharacterized protein LOC106171380 n=1 Tax=Lingula anatina TaxID=7574 RepID=A0A1S3J9S5_LINAN|nr:uncharacterized protein LOC106171380 [Lingula anatina]XP_013407150.1 uncharacterized protein LOC106171380 [Lingula anatina]XP_013407151.1 uncharacterized protein LOC106171380 [Lingula anatina]|eukprot:XP_013407149.1 uncharacterized protein LOC106171380 [Lingula anatina]
MTSGKLNVLLSLFCVTVRVARGLETPSSPSSSQMYVLAVIQNCTCAVVSTYYNQAYEDRQSILRAGSAALRAAVGCFSGHQDSGFEELKWIHTNISQELALAVTDDLNHRKILCAEDAVQDAGKGFFRHVERVIYGLNFCQAEEDFLQNEASLCPDVTLNRVSRGFHMFWKGISRFIKQWNFCHLTSC